MIPIDDCCVPCESCDPYYIQARAMLVKVLGASNSRVNDICDCDLKELADVLRSADHKPKRGAP